MERVREEVGLSDVRHLNIEAEYLIVKQYFFC